MAQQGRSSCARSKELSARQPGSLPGRSACVCIGAHTASVARCRHQVAHACSTQCPSQQPCRSPEQTALTHVPNCRLWAYQHVRRLRQRTSSYLPSTHLRSAALLVATALASTGSSSCSVAPRHSSGPHVGHKLRVHSSQECLHAKRVQQRRLWPLVRHDDRCSLPVRYAVVPQASHTAFRHVQPAFTPAHARAHIGSLLLPMSSDLCAR